MNGCVGATNGDLENAMEGDDDQEDETWKVIEKRNKATVTRTVSDVCQSIRPSILGLLH